MSETPRDPYDRVIRAIRVIRVIRALEIGNPRVPRSPRPYRAVQPPSTNTELPVMNDEASEARNTATPAISSSSPQRPSGIWLMNC